MLILCAMEKEAENIKVKDAEIIITGIGVWNILKKAKLITHSTSKKVVNVGYAGSSEYDVGSVLSVNKVKTEKYSNVVETPALSIKPFDIQATTCITANGFVIGGGSLPLVDMELYYLTLMFPQIQSLKIVSDNLNYDEYTQFNTKDSWDKVNEILNKGV